MRPPETWSDTVESVAASFARAASVYGMNPLLGRLYAVLFLSPEPLALAELAEAVGAAKSTVSVAIRKLEGAKVVRRHWRKGDRRDHYEAVADPVRLVQDWARTFLAAEAHAWNEAVALGESALDAAPPDGPDAAGREEIRARLEAFNAFGELVVTTLAPILGASAASLPPLGASPPEEPGR
jgi:DNA-binding transcriptional regulator GbsR (MarR family)